MCPWMYLKLASLLNWIVFQQYSLISLQPRLTGTKNAVRLHEFFNHFDFAICVLLKFRFASKFLKKRTPPALYTPVSDLHQPKGNKRSFVVTVPTGFHVFFFSFYLFICQYTVLDNREREKISLSCYVIQNNRIPVTEPTPFPL